MDQRSLRPLAISIFLHAAIFAYLSISMRTQVQIDSASLRSTHAGPLSMVWEAFKSSEPVENHFQKNSNPTRKAEARESKSHEHHAIPSTAGVSNSSSETNSGLSAGPTIVGSGDPYYSEVRARIQSHIKYPVSFARKRLQGRVQVALTLLRNGTVEQLEITQPSGSKDLDQLALDSIREAAPFPVFQSTSDAAARKLELPIDFRLP